MYKWLNSRNISAISLASLLFLYLIVALSTVEVRYIETVHRISTEKIFNETIFGSRLADSLAALGLLLLFLNSAIRTSIFLRAISVGFFGLGVTALAIGSEILGIVGLITLPLGVGIVVALQHGRRIDPQARQDSLSSDKTRVSFDWRQVGIAFLGIVIIIEGCALVRWITYPIFPTEIYGDATWKFAEMESALFHTFNLLSPFMLVLLAFSFLYKSYLPHLLRKLARFLRDGQRKRDQLPPASKDESSHSTTIHVYPENERLGTSVMDSLKPSMIASLSVKIPHWTILCCALIIGPLITVYPHLPGVNESGMGISTDERHYLSWLSELREVGAVQESNIASFTETIRAAFMINGGDRALSLLLILGLGSLTGISDAVVLRLILPGILAFGLVVSTYVFVRHGLHRKEENQEVINKDKKIAAIVAILASFSPQIVVGQYAGILANWFALIPAFFALLLALRITQEGECSTPNQTNWTRLFLYSLSLFVILLIAMLFHVYTWGYTTLVIILFTAIWYFSIRKSRRVQRKTILKVTAILASVLLASVITDYAKSSYFGTVSGLSQDSFLAGRTFNLENFNSRWDIIHMTLMFYVGGFLSNPVIVILTLLWIIKVNHLTGLDRLIYCMIFLLTIPILFGSDVIQARILYVIPMYIPAVLALVNMRQRSDRTILIAISAVSLSIAVYALRAMANLYLVIPENFELEDDFLVP
jgi:hypothetical protein